jgi:hypothetical protein
MITNLVDCGGMEKEEIVVHFKVLPHYSNGESEGKLQQNRSHNNQCSE